MIKKLSLITILFTQTTFLLSFTICLVKIESWLNIYYYLNLAIVIFTFVKLRMLDMTELRMEIIFFNWMFSSENNVLFHLLVYLFSFSLKYIFSSSIISYYSSSILNLPLVFSTNIIVKNFNRFLDDIPLSRCSSNLLWLLAVMDKIESTSNFFLALLTFFEWYLFSLIPVIISITRNIIIHLLGNFLVVTMLSHAYEICVSVIFYWRLRFQLNQRYSLECNDSIESC